MTVVSDRDWKSNCTLDSCLEKRERGREREREGGLGRKRLCVGSQPQEIDQ